MDDRRERLEVVRRLVDVDAAFELLRGCAGRHNRELVDLARLVVTEPRQVPDPTR